MPVVETLYQKRLDDNEYLYESSIMPVDTQKKQCYETIDCLARAANGRVVYIVQTKNKLVFGIAFDADTLIENALKITTDKDELIRRVELFKEM